MVRAVHKLFSLSRKKVMSTLPKPYIDYFEESLKPPQRVIDKAPETRYLDYKQDHETGYVYRVPDHPIPLQKNKRVDEGLWGGLGMVEGLFKEKRLRPRNPRVWYPTLEKHTFYSDILDVHINVEVTDRALELIDEHKGLDFYILSTSIQDLGTELGRRLKHKMLLRLAAEDREYIKEKYKDFIRPLEQVEWHGLEVNEAISKQRAMRCEETIEPPLKVKYANELLAKLRQEEQNR